MPSRGEIITAAHERRRRLVAMLVNGPVASTVCRAVMGVSKDLFDHDLWLLKQRGILVSARIMNPLTGRTGVYALAWTGKPLGEPGKWARPIGDEEASPDALPVGTYVPTLDEIAAECAKIRAENIVALRGGGGINDPRDKQVYRISTYRRRVA